jgi:hypothetical protein
MIIHYPSLIRLRVSVESCCRNGISCVRIICNELYQVSTLPEWEGDRAVPSLSAVASSWSCVYCLGAAAHWAIQPTVNAVTVVLYVGQCDARTNFLYSRAVINRFSEQK